MWYLFNGNKSGEGAGEFLGEFKTLTEAHTHLASKMKLTQTSNYVFPQGQRHAHFIGPNSFEVSYDPDRGPDPIIQFIHSEDKSLMGLAVDRASKFFNEDGRQLRIARVAELKTEYPFANVSKTLRVKRPKVKAKAKAQ